MLMMLIQWAEACIQLRNNKEALVVASKEIKLEMLIKPSAWSGLEIRRQDEVRIYRLIIVSLKGWKSSNILGQP